MAWSRRKCKRKVYTYRYKPKFKNWKYEELFCKPVHDLEIESTLQDVLSTCNHPEQSK